MEQTDKVPVFLMVESAAKVHIPDEGDAYIPVDMSLVKKSLKTSCLLWWRSGVEYGMWMQLPG